MRKPMVVVHGDIVSKRYAVDVELEFEKATSLWSLSRGSNFTAPKPLHVDSKSRLIDFEFIPGMISLREPYLDFTMLRRDTSPAVAIFADAGRSLADIHEHLALHSSAKWRPSEPFSKAMCDINVPDFARYVDSLPAAFIHGDFGFSNVHHRLVDEDRKIAIIDCSSDNYTTFSSDTFGPIYLDLAHMVACIDGLVPIHFHPRIRWSDASHLKEAFLSAYEDRRHLPVDREWVSRFAYATVVAKFTKRFPFLWARRAAIWTLYNRFKGNLPKGL